MLQFLLIGMLVLVKIKSTDIMCDVMI